MELRHSVMVPLMGRQADRFHEYTPAKDLAERLEMVQQVRGINGIEVVYPSDFVDPRATIAMIGDSGLPVSAVNLNVKSAKKWQPGSFTATDPQLRADAVADLKIGDGSGRRAGRGNDHLLPVDRWAQLCVPGRLSQAVEVAGGGDRRGRALPL